MNLEYDEECSCCVGPFSSCPSCDRYEKSEEILPESSKKVVWESAGFSPASPNKIIKAKWLEAVTDSAALFVTKQGCVWIPLGMIESMKRTNKGRYKVEVYPSFNPLYRDLAHRYFKNPSKGK